MKKRSLIFVVLVLLILAVNVSATDYFCPKEFKIVDEGCSDWVYDIYGKYPCMGQTQDNTQCVRYQSSVGFVVDYLEKGNDNCMACTSSITPMSCNSIKGMTTYWPDGTEETTLPEEMVGDTCNPVQSCEEEDDKYILMHDGVGQAKELLWENGQDACFSKGWDCLMVEWRDEGLDYWEGEMYHEEDEDTCSVSISVNDGPEWKAEDYRAVCVCEVGDAPPDDGEEEEEDLPPVEYSCDGDIVYVPLTEGDPNDDSKEIKHSTAKIACESEGYSCMDTEIKNAFNDLAPWISSECNPNEEDCCNYILNPVEIPQWSWVDWRAVCCYEEIKTEFSCIDGIDNEDVPDGLIDCQDDDCNEIIVGSNNETCEFAEELTCNDGFDNDDDIAQCLKPDNNLISCQQAGFSWISETIYDSVCTNKAGVGDSCNSNNDCFWQPNFIFSGNSCVNNKCVAHQDIYALLGPSPDTCSDSNECVEQKQCKPIAISYITGACDCMNLSGIDCQDSDCIGSTGPNASKCCSTDEDCSGGLCGENFECYETNCVDQIDNDLNNLTDCEEPYCVGQICGGTTSNPQYCIQGACVSLPEAGLAPIEPQEPPQLIYSYKEILEELSLCQVVKEEGTCNEICANQNKVCIFANAGQCDQEGSSKCTCC
jgi:hypothetical protein